MKNNMNEKTCPECGEVVKQTSYFCANCGHSLKKKSKKTFLICIAGAIFVLAIFILIRIDARNLEEELGGLREESLSTYKSNLFKSLIENNLSNFEYVKSINYNDISHKYTVQINYRKSSSTLYDCAMSAKNFVNMFYSISDINSLQYTCDLTDGQNYIKFQDLSSSTSALNTVSFYDKDWKVINTSYDILENDYIKEYKKLCSKYNYKDLLRNPSDYYDKNAYWFGQILQVVSNKANYKSYRVGVDCTKYSYIDGYHCDNDIFVEYYGNDVFIEDDMVKMWGTMNKTYTYTTVLGASLTIPKFEAKIMELN